MYEFWSCSSNDFVAMYEQQGTQFTGYSKAFDMIDFNNLIQK